MKFLIIVIIVLTLLFFPSKALAAENFWEIQSVDTMKYSRDLAREKENDKDFEKTIKSQIESIAKTGATHVAIATPYDAEFVPYLKRWVKAARENNLKVWFRGNFSGWEGWFGYEKMDREVHIKLVENFILNNSELFQNGDIFSPCTECENGGPGDPRYTGDVKGYRQFLISEYEVTKSAFENINKDVGSNYFSMNWDVAILIMDSKTTQSLDGLVVIDHYVYDPDQLSTDVIAIAKSSGGEVFLGEFGSPVPDIHGVMSEHQQALWLDGVLSKIAGVKGVVGVNYWTSFGGTTSIWKANGTKKSAVDVLSAYFKPKVVSGIIVNELGRGVKGASVSASAEIVKTDRKGGFNLFVVPSMDEISINADGYEQIVIKTRDLENSGKVVLTKKREDVFFKIQKWFYNLLRKLI